jgi:hypothetical protein
VPESRTLSLQSVAQIKILFTFVVVSQLFYKKEVDCEKRMVFWQQSLSLDLVNLDI